MGKNAQYAGEAGRNERKTTGACGLVLPLSGGQSLQPELIQF
jgi:hypothetical protein